MGLTWGPPESCRPQMGPMLAPWSLLSGTLRDQPTWTSFTLAVISSALLVLRKVSLVGHLISFVSCWWSLASLNHPDRWLNHNIWTKQWWWPTFSFDVTNISYKRRSLVRFTWNIKAICLINVAITAVSITRRQDNDDKLVVSEFRRAFCMTDGQLCNLKIGLMGLHGNSA